VRWNRVEDDYCCVVGFVTCFYISFVYCNLAIDCIVDLIKLFYYQDFCSLLFLLSLSAISNVVAGKTVLQWTHMLLDEPIILEIILMILSIVIFVITIMQGEGERGLAMRTKCLEGTSRGDRKTMTGPEITITTI